MKKHLKETTYFLHYHMGIGKRGQITYEYLIIIGMVIFLVIPFFDYSFLSLGENLMIVEGVTETVHLATTLEEVSYLGTGSVKNLDVDDVKSIDISLDGYVTATLANDKQITIPSSIQLSEARTLEPGRVAVANIDGDVVPMNAPFIKEAVPTNMYDAETLTIMGEHFDINHAVLILEGTEAITSQHIRYEYRPLIPAEDSQIDTTQQLSFALTQKPGQGAYTILVIQQHAASNSVGIVHEPIPVNQ